MEPTSYENLTVSVRKTEAGDSYQFGVILHDAFLPFAAFKAGGFEEDVQSAIAAQDAAKAQAAADKAAKPKPAPKPAPKK